MDVFAEITAAAPPDQQRFPVSCESDGAPQRVTLSSRPGVAVSLPPPRSLCGPQAEQEKPALESALIHGETFLWSANITAKQVKYRVILCVS